MGSKVSIGFIGLLTIAFIMLKLIGVITWSWAWVLSPIWISAVGVIAVLAAFFGWVWAFSKSSKFSK